MRIAFHVFVGAVAAILSISLSAQAATEPHSVLSGQQTRTLKYEGLHNARIQYLLFLPNSYETSVDRWEIEELVHAIEVAGGHPQLTVLLGRDHYVLDVYDRPDLYKRASTAD